MANICSFEMCVKGEHNNIESFYNAMSQNGNIFMGRGAEAEISFYDNGNTAFISGWCKWSVQSAMIDNAVSMRTNPGQWYWGDDTDPSNLEFITLWEACERWNLAMEVYSEESGCCFQEHYMYDDGQITCDCVEWNQYYMEDFDTKEDAEQELDIQITDEEWNSGEEFICRGGFASWDFVI